MARVYSHSESRAKGSVGMTTYRTVRGRVIQSQKVSPWDPSVEAVGGATRWNPRTALLGIISLFCSNHAQSIINSFNRTKAGSQRNYFMKRNYKALSLAFAELAEEYAETKVAPALQDIEDALGEYAAAHPNTIYRIKKTGLDIKFLDGNWDDSDDPAQAMVISSMEATLNEDYNMVSVAIEGRHLSAAVKLYLDGVLIDGSVAVGEGATSAVFTPNTAPLVVGTLPLSAKVGSVTKKTIMVSGDLRPRQNFKVVFAGLAPAGLKINGEDITIPEGATFVQKEIIVDEEPIAVQVTAPAEMSFSSATIEGDDDIMSFSSSSSVKTTMNNPFTIYYSGETFGDNDVKVAFGY